MKALFLQAIKFIGLSGVGWILDFSVYTFLGFFSENIILNNIISSWVGVTFVFIFATRKVFKNRSKIPLKLKYIIYLIYQTILIFLISKLLAQINVFLVSQTEIWFVQEFSTILSKIIVTPITMVLNFIVMKHIIEKL